MSHPPIQLSPKIRKRTLLLPLVLALLATLFFYGFGGGHGDNSTAGNQPGIKGVNMTLPSPQPPKGQTPDKLGYYKQADIDSTRKAEQRKIDPNFAHPDTFRPISTTPLMTLSKTDADRNADQITRQIEEMKRTLAIQQSTFATRQTTLTSRPTTISLQQPTRLASRFPENPEPMPTRFRPQTSKDPELDRIDDVLEKLIRVQHPEGTKPDTVLKADPPLLVTIADDEGERQPGFIDITDNSPRDTAHDNSIAAEISGDQTISAGSTLELRLSQPVNISGHAIPKYQLIHGLASLNGERLMIVVNSIRVGQSILPVALQVYDLDGLAGIRVPGAITRDASKESADQAINSLAATSVDPTIGGQAANAGLRFARSLATRKVRLIQVAIPAGYQVLLKNIKH